MKQMLAVMTVGLMAVAGFTRGQDAAPASPFAGLGLDELNAAIRQRQEQTAALKSQLTAINQAIEAQDDIKALKAQAKAAATAYHTALAQSAALEGARQVVKDAEAAAVVAREKAAAECAEAAAPRTRIAEQKTKLEALEKRAAELKAGTVEGMTPEQIKAEAATVKSDIGAVKTALKEIEKKELAPALKQTENLPAVREAYLAVKTAKKALEDAAKTDAELTPLAEAVKTAETAANAAVKARQTERAAEIQPLNDQLNTINKELKELNKLLKAAQPAS